MHPITLLLLGAPLLQFLAGSENITGQKRKVPSGCGSPVVNGLECIAEAVHSLQNMRERTYGYGTDMCTEDDDVSSAGCYTMNVEEGADLLNFLKRSKEVGSDEYDGYYSNSEKEEVIDGSHFDNENMANTTLKVTRKKGHNPKKARVDHTLLTKETLENLYITPNNSSTRTLTSKLQKLGDRDLIADYMARSFNDNKYSYLKSLLEAFVDVPVPLRRLEATMLRRINNSQYIVFNSLKVLIENRPTDFVDMMYSVFRSKDARGSKIKFKPIDAQDSENVCSVIAQRALEFGDKELVRLLLTMLNGLKIPNSLLVKYLLLGALPMDTIITRNMPQLSTDPEARRLVIEGLIEPDYSAVLKSLFSRPNITKFSPEEARGLYFQVIKDDRGDALKTLLPEIRSSLADWEKSEDGSPLCYAAQHGAFECLKVLLNIDPRYCQALAFTMKNLVCVDLIVMERGQREISRMIRSKFDGFIPDYCYRIMRIALENKNTNVVGYIANKMKASISSSSTPQVDQSESLIASICPNFEMTDFDGGDMLIDSANARALDEEVGVGLLKSARERKITWLIDVLQSVLPNDVFMREQDVVDLSHEV